MFIAFLLSLGLLISTVPEPGDSSDVPEVMPAGPSGSRSLRLLQSLPRHGLPAPASREDITESAPEGKEEESGGSFSACPSCRLNPSAIVRRREYVISVHDSVRGFLHQLHRCWQLVC